MEQKNNEIKNVLSTRKLIAIIAIVDNDKFSKSDVAVILEGDGFFRYMKAVSLYKAGLVSKIVFSGNTINKDYGSYPFEEIKPLILKEGVKEEDLIHEKKSTQTREQAVEIVKMANENGWKKIALIASPDHQYRAYLTFLREILNTKSNIILFNTPVRELDWFVDSGWGKRIDRFSLEIDRIKKYSKLGHLANMEEVIEYQKWKESLLND